jgi:hypothetical protein
MCTKQLNSEVGVRIILIMRIAAKGLLKSEGKLSNARLGGHCLILGFKQPLYG